MDNFLTGRSIKEDFEAQVTAVLMIQSNALIPIKRACKEYCVNGLLVRLAASALQT